MKFYRLVGSFTLAGMLVWMAMESAAAEGPKRPQEATPEFMLAHWPPPKGIPGPEKGTDLGPFHFSIKEAPSWNRRHGPGVIVGSIENKTGEDQGLTTGNGGMEGVLIFIEDTDGDKVAVRPEAALRLLYTAAGNRSTGLTKVGAHESYDIECDAGKVYELLPGHTYKIQFEWFPIHGKRLDVPEDDRLLSNVITVIIPVPEIGKRAIK